MYTRIYNQCVTNSQYIRVPQFRRICNQCVTLVIRLELLNAEFVTSIIVTGVIITTITSTIKS